MTNLAYIGYKVKFARKKGGTSFCEDKSSLTLGFTKLQKKSEGSTIIQIVENLTLCVILVFHKKRCKFAKHYNIRIKIIKMCRWRR